MGSGGQVLQYGDVPVVPDGHVSCTQILALTADGYAVIVQVLVQSLDPKAVRVIDVSHTVSVNVCEQDVPTNDGIEGWVALQTVLDPSLHTCLVPVLDCPQAFVLEVQLYVVQVIGGGGGGQFGSSLDFLLCREEVVVVDKFQ